METKVKKFSHKLLALFMAVVMGLTCFSGVFSAYAASSDVKYYDDAVEYNNLAWNVLSDEQAATALLDYLDVVLAEVGPKIDKLLAGALPSSGVYYYDAKTREFGFNVVVLKGSVKVYTHSVDELLVTLSSAESLIRRYEGVLGDAGNIQLSSVRKVAGTENSVMQRKDTSSCDILRALLGILQKNAADYNGKDVIGELLRGGFDLGTLGTFVKVDIYGIIGNAIGVNGYPGKWYQDNFVYDIVQSLIFNNTNWYTSAEKQAYKNNPSTFVFDDQLLDKLTKELLQKINTEITYQGGSLDAQTVSSRVRYKAIKEKAAADGISFKAAAAALNYDPELVYTDDGNVYLFVYGTNEDGSLADNAEKIFLDKNDTLFQFGYRALEIAWKTVLSDTIGTVRVNYDVDRGHGSNFDNQYYYWAKSHIEGGWDTNNLEAMYSEENINAWCAAVCSDYHTDDPEEFKSWVINNYEFTRTAAEDSTGKWSDIDETTLFTKLRYSPLADYGFGMETGPINLYFMQTGTPNVTNFFNNEYSEYSEDCGLIAGLNDALVAVVKDIFVQGRSNVYGDAAYPTLDKINPTVINDSTIRQITNTLVGNALRVVQYTADSIDSNILKAFYTKYGANATLTEQNLEEAMMPLLIACVGQINLNGFKLKRCIHPEDFDACKDAEALIFVLLREYLSYILPEKNYNSLAGGVNADGSLNADTITATLDGTILPMARDAVVYVMQGYVPVTGKEGNNYDVYERPVNDSNTLFDLLNSVVCYYGGEYTFKNNKVAVSKGAMAVGALLGACSPTDGTSLINSDQNDIWDNIDLIANKLLPVLGELQYGTAGATFSSEDLLYNDIVRGALQIGDTSIHSSGYGGVSNIIYRFLTIVSANPISSTPITLTIYDVVAQLLNGLFGARYSGQGWTKVVPDRTTAHPFDDVLQKNVVSGTSGSDVGVIGKFLCNVSEFSGYGVNGVNTYPDSIIRGLMFAIKAVQSFVPSILTSIGDHKLQMGTAAYAQKTIEGCTGGTEYETKFNFTNNSAGVNNAYVDGINNKNVQLSRYYMIIKDVKVNNSSDAGASVTGYSTTQKIAPGETVELTAKSTYEAVDATASTTVTATVYYSVCLANGTVLYGKGTADDPYLESTAYQYLTGAKGWYDNVYTQNGGTWLKSTLESDSANQSLTDNDSGYKAYTSAAFGSSDKVSVGYPKDLVISTSDPNLVEKFQFRIRNLNGSGWGNADRSVDGWFCYDDASGLVNDLSGATNISVNIDNAIPVFDKETGDLLKIGRYDVSLDGVTWDRKPEWNGYSESDIEEYVYKDDRYKDHKDELKLRTHVAYTIQEAQDAGIIKAYHKNAAGVVEYVYMQTGNGTNYDTTLSKVTMRGPVDGIYINVGKITVPRNQSKYTDANGDTLFKYDNETPLQAGSYPVRLCFYNAGSSAKTKLKATTGAQGKECTLYIADTSSSDALDNSFNNLAKILANYRSTDFNDPSVKKLASDALFDALSVQSAVLTPTTAAQLSDKTYLAPTLQTAESEYGDRAYVPFTSSNVNNEGHAMPIKVLAEATLGPNNVYYYDKACTMPIYSNVPLTAADVSNGKDPAGIPVIQGTDKDADKFYLRNTPLYKTVWDTTSYSAPWRKPTTTQDTKTKDDKVIKLYEQVTYVYRDVNGDKVNSDNEWMCKFPATAYKCYANDGTSADNRGLITQAADRLAYAEDQVYKSINTSIAEDLYNKVSLVRNNLNNNNFEVVTYNKMVEIAKDAERNYTLNIPYSYDELIVEEATGEPILDANGKKQYRVVEKIDEWVRFKDYNGYINNKDIVVDKENITTTSSLSSVQVAEYLRLFDTYVANVVERGYNGSQLEQEIACASGNDYSAFGDVTTAEYVEVETTNPETGKPETKWECETPAVVTSATATTAEFGAWEDGMLVNDGPIIYADNLWTRYVEALANAVSIAQTGNGDYEFKASANYVPTAKEAYTAQITDSYSADTALQAAEIALETAHQITVNPVAGGSVTIDGQIIDSTKPYAVYDNTWVSFDGIADAGYEFAGFAEDYVMVSENEDGTTSYGMWIKDDVAVTPIFNETGATEDTYTVTADIVVATNSQGDTLEKPAHGEYTIELYADADYTDLLYTFTSNCVVENDGNGSEWVASNTFSFAVPNGTYYAVISYNCAMARELVIEVNGADIEADPIAMVACDFNGDTFVNISDTLLMKAVASSGSVTSDDLTFLDFDLNGDGFANIADSMIVMTCASAPVNYPELIIR